MTAPALRLEPASLQQHLQRVLGEAYVVERELGRGGMGAVFLAHDRALERPVAIKVLPPELASQAQLRERFLRETRTVAGFSHPNIVPVHAIEERADLLLYVMGYVEGETLTQRVLRGGPLASPDAVRLIQEVAWALAYAHQRGVVHRDVKPDNILIERATGRALVTDFGIARAATTSTLTTIGEVVGTPHYMSPEQCAGEAIDGRSDLYALGVTAFVALTGRPPFDAPTTQAILAMHLTQAPPALAELRPDLPQALTDAVDRCLGKEPGDRFPDGDALVQALEPVRASQPQVAPQIRLFIQQGEQMLRLTFVLILFGVVAWNAANPRADADRKLVAVFTLTALAGTAYGLTLRARALVRQGFRHADVRAGAQTVVAERQAARLALRMDPVENRRLRLANRWRVAGILGGIALFLLVLLRLRVQIADGWYSVSAIGLWLSMAGFAMIAFALMTFFAEPGRVNPLQRLGPPLWSGAVGRLVFRIAERFVPSASVARAATTSPTAPVVGNPISVFESLPRERRRPVQSLRPELDRLEQRIAALRERQQALDLALAEARQGAGQPSEAVEDSRSAALIDDLARARRETAEHLRRLLQAREAVRLQLLRFRSGIGSAADVATELVAALRDGNAAEAVP